MLKSFSALAGGTTGAVNYKGTWNASTNTPTLASSVGTNGDYYVVSVAGSTTLNGISNWGVGDWAVFNGSVWQRVEGGADVNAVNLTVSGNTTLSGPVSVTPTANSAAINISGISVTGSNSTSGLGISGTWNTTGTPSLILADVTDTASDTGSLLMDMRVGTVPMFTVRKDGALFATKVNLAATQAADSIGTRGVPQNSQSAAYTLVIEDAGKHILHPSADTTARTFTIPANGSVAFPIGTTVTFVNQNAGGVITIAITTDTMRLAGAGTTGSRTLAANGIATCIKLTSTEWIISGTGLT
jgi:hypothetical protein